MSAVTTQLKSLLQEVKDLRQQVVTQQNSRNSVDIREVEAFRQKAAETTKIADKVISKQSETIKELKSENKSLKARVAELERENGHLKKEKKELQDLHAFIEDELEAQKECNASLRQNSASPAPPYSLEDSHMSVKDTAETVDSIFNNKAFAIFGAATLTLLGLATSFSVL